MNICKVLTVAGAGQGEVIKAIENSDFKDFTTAETKAITPKEFCDLMENARGNDF